MSGYRGTIGDPKKDKVVAWIYDRVDEYSTKKKTIFKLIASMFTERNHLMKIADMGFRRRMAKLVRDDFSRQIDGLVGIKTPMGFRLWNLAVRSHSQAIGSGMNAPACYWCEEAFMPDEPYKMIMGHKLHLECAEEFNEEQQDT